jgi:hypothetical protein
MMLDAAHSGKHPGQQKTVQEIPVRSSQTSQLRETAALPAQSGGDQKNHEHYDGTDSKHDWPVRMISTNGLSK